MNKPPDAPVGQENLTCPFLGMLRDRSTALAFPSERNLCHHSRSLDTPCLEHQRTYCLTGEHHLCRLSAGEPVVSLPEELRLQDQLPHQGKKKNWLIVILAVSMITVAGVILSARIESNRVATPGLSSSSTIPADYFPLQPGLPTPSTTGVAPATSDPATSKPVLTITPPQASRTESGAIHGLDEPIGTAYRFVIHRILQGESLFVLATRYNTSATAIKKVNYNMPDPVWVDWPVIIPIDTRDVSGLPAFEAYEQMEDDVSIEALAELLNLDGTSLIFYNGLETGYILSSGEWLLIPHSME